MKHLALHWKAILKKPKRFTETRSWNNKWEKELFSFYSIQEFERILQSSVRGRLSVSESSDLTQEMLRNGARSTWSAELPAHGGIRRDAPDCRVTVWVAAEIVVTEMAIRVPFRNVAVRLRALLQPVLAHVSTVRLVLAPKVVLSVSGHHLTAAQVLARIRQDRLNLRLEQIELLHFDEVFLPRIGRPLLGLPHVNVVADDDDIQGCDLLEVRCRLPR